MPNIEGEIVSPWIEVKKDTSTKGIACLSTAMNFVYKDANEFLAIAHQQSLPYERYLYVRDMRSHSLLGLPDKQKTGMEGYFVSLTPEQMIDSLASQGRFILDSLVRRNQRGSTIVRNVTKALNFERLADISTIEELDIILGSTLAIFRAFGLRRDMRAYDSYREETTRRLQAVPLPTYVYKDGKLEQTVKFPNIKERIGLTQYLPKDVEGYEVIKNIGLFGHPIVRTLLHHPEYRSFNKKLW